MACRLAADAAGRAPRDPLDREVAFDLLVRLPERAAVLLGMTARVVATASSTPPATLVTTRLVRQLRAGPRIRVSRVTSGARSRARHPTPGAPRRPQACPSSSSPP
ncbi:hypothetical protein L841_2349 [Mycobacterium sp. MAC_080597_8934]|nr:hypothetical protein L841_2349 [Mycobacterium sp. MAC_080597_8934]